MGKTYPVPQLPKDGLIGQEIKDTPWQIKPFAVAVHIRGLEADRDSQTVNQAPQIGGVDHSGLDHTIQVFPQPCAEEQNVGADFPDVLLNGFRLFGEIDDHRRDNGSGNADALLGSPGRRNKRKILVSLLDPPVQQCPLFYGLC